MYENLPEEALGIIRDVLRVKKSEIANIEVLKQGMTNRSFLFSCQNQKYIVRIPGEGTGFLINRQQELDVYETIKDKGCAIIPFTSIPIMVIKLLNFCHRLKPVTLATCRMLNSVWKSYALSII